MDVEFIKSAFQEKHYPPPDRPEIAFAGKSNVGKSSLLNTLVNRRKLARTSSTPGRTQAINFFRFGKTLYLVDLPGYGFAKVPTKIKKSWGLMVEDYLRTRKTLKAVVVILDIRRDPSSGDEDLINWLNHYQIEPILVLTKADKISRQKTNRRANLITGGLKDVSFSRPVIFSSHTRQGVEELWEIINETALPQTT
ncbi:MAG: YihA family ribosome biogenesis GTP-binding protein [Deltaproteobacteria bacterium]|jgi:GTP-binding protein|nr:YihA family ribosome biogenesis GTP-binding protein [Deltaproteobacteria bacterium]